ncbi:uncharacterized protein TNCV_5106611 [Trichonephila clavipes]|uniref:Uncharacterized protein n=1 Tax=Trichonephila clavipes TaxID=2585209 RepID=A0A8X6R9Q5_TRICX|nr:uncharacterized protein TNCV_5106611 [Trichonephila clavipes]
MLCDTRELADEIDIPANFELTQSRYRVRRRNVNFDYETRDDPIENPTLKNKAEFYFFTLDKAINALESRYKCAGPDRRDSSGFVALLIKKESPTEILKVHIEPGFCSKSRYSFKDIAYSLIFLLCLVPENRQNQKEHDTRMVNFLLWTPLLEKFLRELLCGNESVFLSGNQSVLFSGNSDSVVNDMVDCANDYSVVE